MSKKNKFPDFSQWDFDGETLYDFELRTLNQKRKKKRKTPSKITNNSTTSINQSCEEEFIEQYLEFQPDSFSVAGDVEKEYKRFSAERGIKQVAYTFQAYLLQEHPEIRRVEKYIPELDKTRVVLEGVRLKTEVEKECNEMDTNDFNEDIQYVFIPPEDDETEDEEVKYSLDDIEVAFESNIKVSEEEIDDIYYEYKAKSKKSKKKSAKKKKASKKSKRSKKIEKSKDKSDTKAIRILESEMRDIKKQQALHREELYKTELRILYTMLLGDSNEKLSVKERVMIDG